MPRKMERRRPASLDTLGNVSVPGTRVGAIISLGLVLLAWAVIPLARPFILGAGGLGLIFGLILWRKHSK